MDHTIKLLFQILIGFVLVNMAINVTLYLVCRQKEYLRVVFYWAIVSFVFVVQGVFQVHPLHIALAFTVTVIPVFYVTRIILSIIDRKLSILLYAVLIFSGLATTLLLYRLNVPFNIFALPLSVAVATPFFEGIYWIFFKRRTRSTKIQKLLAGVMVVGIIHCFNFALYRMEDGAQIWGWMVSFILYQMFSVLLPAFMVERITNIEKQEQANANEKLLLEIKERERSEKSLLENEEKFRQVVTTTRDAIVIIDSETRKFIEVNKACEDLYGYRYEEFLSMMNKDITNEPENSEESIIKTIAGKLNTIPLRYHRKKDGTVFPVEITASVFELKGRKVLCGIIRDITERVKMEEVLLQSEKLKSMGTVTAGISHEFNNILNIISGNVQLLQMDYKDDSKLLDSFHIIMKSISDGAKITGRMFDFTKQEDISEEQVSADPIELVNHALDFTMPRWEKEAQAKGIDYSIDKENIKAVPEIMCSPSQLREVFVNIINNALDAMPKGGRISFSTWGQDDKVLISIADTGKGMTEEVKKSIFDPFFTTRRPEGTGLGMSVTYSIINRHGGSIKVESEVGSGSTFTMQLPASIKTVGSTISHKLKQKKKGKGLRILVVDDEKETCDVLDRYLSKKGYMVEIVDNGTDAINLIRSEPFNLVLCDFVMPKVNGLEVVRFIAGLEERPRVGIITGWKNISKSLDEEGVKVDFIVRKPFNFSELTKHINELFGAGSK